MSRSISLADILDAAEQLSPDEQWELAAILTRRLNEAGRQRVVADVRQARQECGSRPVQPATPAQIMSEILK